MPGWTAWWLSVNGVPPGPCHATSRNDSFFDRGASRVQSVLNAGFLFLHLGLGRGADIYDRMLMRDLPDGSTEITTLSWWRSMDAVRAFAGRDPERARYYPEDDRFLLEKPDHVEHHSVIAGDLALRQ